MSPSRKNYKPEYRERRKYDLDKDRTWLRLDTEELKQVAEVMAQKLNLAKGPVIFLIPTRGWSAADAPGGPAYDPKEDEIFTKTLKKMCRPEIGIESVEAHLNDPAFAQAVVQAVHKIAQ